jgi:flagellar basal-body rod protein FlgC
MGPGSRILSFFRTAARGLEAQRIALTAATDNIANAETTRTANGQPYAIKRAVHRVDGKQYEQFGQMLAARQSQLSTTNPKHMSMSSSGRALSGIGLGPTTEIVEDLRTRSVFDPAHPDADPEGYVQYPDINVVEEMARMVSANRLYEANLSSVQSAKDMIKRTLEI